jgi:3-oxoacyl-[acyl-carrier-protein] synthase II
VKGWRCSINAACASATIALAMAASRIEQGEAESALVCGLDLVSEFVFSGFSALKALSPQTCRPFDVGRDGLILGEGAACLLLMSERACRQAKRPSLGRIAGWGIASDANHITAPSRTGEGLVLAVRQALDRAGLQPADIAAINAHGTGSVYNDAMELTAFSTVFHPLPPCHSIKGATGHTMGACGVIETLVGLCSLRDQRIPPTVGVQTSEPAGQGRISAQAQAILGDFLLTTNSGFGGVNGAVILQRSSRW